MGLRQTVTMRGTRQAALNYNPRLDLEPPSWRLGVREVGGLWCLAVGWTGTRSDLPKAFKVRRLQMYNSVCPDIQKLKTFGNP